MSVSQDDDGVRGFLEGGGLCLLRRESESLVLESPCGDRLLATLLHADRNTVALRLDVPGIGEVKLALKIRRGRVSFRILTARSNTIGRLEKETSDALALQVT